MTATEQVKGKSTRNPLDAMMTPAQIARRKFKAALPRKIQERSLSAMEALGELFTQLDRFRGVVREQGLNPDVTVHAALAYCQPGVNPAVLAEYRTVPNRPKVGEFCDEVMTLPGAQFLGIVFIQHDPNSANPAYRFVSFCLPFKTGPEAASRLHFAQNSVLQDIQKLAKELRGRS